MIFIREVDSHTPSMFPKKWNILVSHLCESFKILEIPFGDVWLEDGGDPPDPEPDPDPVGEDDPDDDAWTGFSSCLTSGW